MTLLISLETGLSYPSLDSAPHQAIDPTENTAPPDGSDTSVRSTRGPVDRRAH